MTNIIVRIEGLNKVRQGFLLAPKRMARNLQRAIGRSTGKIQRESKDIIRTGRGYSRRPFDTGQLFRSIFTEIRPLQGRVFANSDYAIYIHEGLSTSRRYGPRPFFKDAVKASDSFIQDEFRKAAQDVLNRI